jgi:HEAT repeat protein
LRSDNYFLASLADGALGKIARDLALPLPQLAKSLSTAPNTNIDETVNSLTTLVVSQNTSERLRLASTMALGLIGKPAHAAIPALVRTLNDDDQLVQSAATNALRNISPEVLTNAPKNF